jgi:hypothetical protein
VEVTENDLTVLSIESNASNLLTRRLSRGVMASCFRVITPRAVLAITGSPGIGKTWTLLYGLQQALLYKEAYVLFFKQKTGDAFFCVRRHSKIFVWKSFSESLRAASCLFSKENILILLDPHESTAGGAKFVDCCGRLIYAASNNIEHFRNDALKRLRPYRYLSPWTREEFVAAYPKMDSEVSLEEALERAEHVGLLPGYLIKMESVYDQRGDALNCAILNLALQKDAISNIVAWEGLDHKGEDLPDKAAGAVTVPGALIAVFTEIQDAGVVDYDGLKGANYEERQLQIVSDTVMEKVVEVNRCNTLGFWGKVDCEKASAMGKALESLFWNDDLARGVCGLEFKMRRYELTEGRQCGHLSYLMNTLSWTKCSEQLEIRQLKDVFNLRSKICQMKAGTAAIDFAGPGRKVYQLTVSKKDSLSLSGMRDIFIAGGYLHRKNGVLEMNRAAKQEKLEFYWVVPPGIEPTWRTKCPKMVEATTPEGKLVKECQERHMIQYLLIMDVCPLLRGTGRSN